MIIEYRNSEDQPVTLQQVALLDRYREVKIEPSNNQVKIVNKFENGNLEFIEYFIDNSENVTDVVNALKIKCDAFNIRMRAVYNASYVVDQVSEYRNDQICFKTKYLIDNNNKKICWEDLDLVTNQPKYENTEKFYFDSNGIEVLAATYNSGASLESIVYKPTGDENWGQDWEAYDSSTFPDLQTKFTQNLDYYLDATLEP